MHSFSRYYWSITLPDIAGQIHIRRFPVNSISGNVRPIPFPDISGQFHFWTFPVNFISNKFHFFSILLDSIFILLCCRSFQRFSNLYFVRFQMVNWIQCTQIVYLLNVYCKFKNGSSMKKRSNSRRDTASIEFSNG